MNIRRALTATLCAGLILGTAPTAQGHEPTFTVTPTAITLLSGTFSDNGHLNVRTNLRSWNVHFEGKCTNRDDHECAGVRHADAQFIGKSVYPLC